ncbi:MAG TPA: ATP-binding cassette domain-containing protein [Bacteroidaceae bacterium]|nr:ATP-binding cassette domain-containing protein [Bacteroidaceae bacterium]
MLSLKNITAGYTKENMILKGVNLTVSENEVVALVGQNGSGKSTLAKAVMNMVPHIAGDMYFDGEGILRKDTHAISKKGIGFFMQGGVIFPNLNVRENLTFSGANLKDREFKERWESIKGYFELFNNGRMNLRASYLSGGEQHQLALAMVLMNKPKFMILDEPSAGLSPANVKSLYTALDQIRKNEVNSMLLIEQNVNAAIEFSDRVVLLQEGKIAKEKLSKNLDSSEKIDEFFFGKLR